MKKRLSDAQIRVIVLIGFLLIPFALAYLGVAIKMEWLGRLLGISIAFLGLPVLIAWLAINPKYKKSWGFSFGKKRYYNPGRFFGIAIAILLLAASRNLVMDIASIMFDGPSTTTAVVADTRHSPYSVVVRGQWINFKNNLSQSFFSAYSPFWLHPEDTVEIKYLPHTKYIIETKRLSN